MLAYSHVVLRMGSVLVLLCTWACTSSPADPEPTGSQNGAEVAGHGEVAGKSAAAGNGAAGQRSAAGSRANAGRAAAGASAAGASAAGTSAAGSGGAAVGQDAGPDDVDAAVSCDGEIVANKSGCLQDDAFCYPLGDGRYCTGPQAPNNPASMKQCGARAGDTCLADEYCAYQPGQYCGQADAQSTCQKRPTSCSGPSAPVCGCDQNTYQSACEANKAGSGIFATGACK